MKLERLQELSGIRTLTEAVSDVFADALSYNTEFTLANKNNPTQLKKFKLRMTKLGMRLHDTVAAQEMLDAIKTDFPIEKDAKEVK